MSAATTDIEKQIVNDVPVVPVAARKTLGAGVSEGTPKKHTISLSFEDSTSDWSFRNDLDYAVIQLDGMARSDHE